MRYLLSLIFLLAPFCGVYSQSLDPSQLNVDQAKYIEFIPPSPAVAGLADFSRPGVSLSSGNAHFSIPLTSINLGSYSVPVSLSYSTNGVKVDELSGRAGTGFQFLAGGAIIRSVSGKGADESKTFISPPPNSSPISREFLEFMKLAVGGGYDSEADIFSYSFGEHSGKFYLNANKNPVQFPKSNLKVITNFGSTEWNFKIVDATGNEFYFGGVGFTEKSKKPLSCGKTMDVLQSTAWFLQKIILFNGETINFTYAPVNYRYLLSRNQTIYKTPFGQDFYDQAINCKCPERYQQDCTTQMDTETCYLTSIKTSRGDSVKFHYGTRVDCGDVLLKSVSSFVQGYKIASYEMQYQLAANRYYLESITKKSKDDLTGILYYKMTYDDPGALPPRLSTSQDEWGYANGKDNGDSFVPKPADPDMADKFISATADRSVNEALAKKGTLTTIQYPTGGYDKISYESNTIYDLKTIYPPFKTIGGDTSSIGPRVTKDLGHFTISYIQKVTLFVDCSGPDTPTKQEHGEIIIRKIGDNDSSAVLGAMPGENRQSSVRLAPGEYYATLNVVGAGTDFYGEVTFRDGNIQKVFENQIVGGVRVKEIAKYLGNGQLANRTKYAYNDIDSENSSAVYKNKPSYYKEIYYEMWCFLPPTAGSGGTDVTQVRFEPCYYEAMVSSSLFSLFNNSGNSVAYKVVTESEGDASENGLIVHKFDVGNDAPGEFLLGSTIVGGGSSNTSIKYPDSETETTHYKKTGDGFSPIKKRKYYYKLSSQNYDSTECYIVNKLFQEYGTSSSGTVYQQELDPYEATRYRIYSPWKILDSLVDVDIADNANFSRFTTYKYDPVTLLPTTVTVRDSKGQTIVTQKYFSGMASIPGLTSDQLPLITSLKNKNSISQLIYQKTLVNGAFNGSYRMTVSDQTSPSSLILPKDVKQYFTDETEGIGFTIMDYDAIGNVLDRVNNDGVIKSYIWDYSNAYPIAEIIGANKNQVASTSFEADGTGNWNITGSPTKTPDATAPTGKNIGLFTTGGSLQKTGLTAATTYTVSYWYKSGTTVTIAGSTNAISTPAQNGWTNVRVRVSGVTSITVTVSGNGAVDDVRLYPENATMTTYTYDPGVGIISTSDANNVVTRYYYDTFNRLTDIKDSNGNLLKNYRYNYKNISTKSQ